MEPYEKVFVIVYKIVNNSIEFLALKPNPEPGRNSDDYVITGGVEPYDKSIEATVIREVSEEIGVESNNIVSLEYTISYTDHITIKDYSEHCYGVKINDEPIILNEEHIGYRWLNKNDFIDTIWWDYDKSILEKMIKIIEIHENLSDRYSYKIILDLEKDADNWYAGCNSESFGVEWKTRVPEDIYKKINSMSKKESLKYLIPFLKQKYINEKPNIDNYIIFLENIYKEKFDNACKKVSELTGKDLYINNFTIFITTFPRGPYNFGKGYIWEYIGWNNPIAGLMHELLHFQFHHYWRDDLNSAISKLSEAQFQYLKESLTVILDDDIVPLIERPDKGYDIHQKYRLKLHKFWKTNHDFKKLVDYGLQILPDFVK